MFNKNGTALGETIRWQTENASFIAVNLFWMINRNVFFASSETADSVLVNGCVNVLFSTILIVSAIRKSAGTIQSYFRTGYGLFIVYNVVPILLQQKSMFGIFLVIEIIYTVYSIVRIAKTKLPADVEISKKEAYLFGAIIAFFALVFIARGISLTAEISPGKPITNEISVGIADMVICVYWLAGGIGLVFNRPEGKRFILSIYINGSLLFLALILYLLAFPICTESPIDFSALGTIALMSLFFFIPLIILVTKTRKALIRV